MLHVGGMLMLQSRRAAPTINMAMLGSLQGGLYVDMRQFRDCFCFCMLLGAAYVLYLSAVME